MDNTNHINIPKLRFKEFSGEWENKTLGEVSNKVLYGVGCAATTYDGVNKYLRITDINESSRAFVPNPLTSPDGIIEDKYKLVKGDIVFARTGASTGKSYLYNEKDGNLVYAGFLIKFHINKADPYFVYANTFKEHYDKWVQVMSIRSGQPGINAEEYKRLPLLLPTKPEQQKIASFLTSIDKKIELLTQKEKLLKDYKKGIMQKIFSQEIRFKSDDGSEFPEWVEKRLGDYLIHKSDRNKNFGDNLVLSVSNKKGFITQGEQFGGYEVASKDLSNYKVVNKDDYAYNPSRINVGSIARLKSIDHGIVSPMYVVFKAKETLNNIFFDNLIQTYLFKHLVIVNCSGSVRDSLGFDDMCSFKFKLPYIEEQTKIANFLSAIDSKIEQVTKQLEHTKEFKKGLLQQMFV